MNAETNRILDLLSKHFDDASDYRLAKELGVTKQAVSSWRRSRTHMSDDAVIAASAILKMDSNVLLALIRAECASSDSARKVWTSLARRLQRSAAAGAAILTATAMLAHPVKTSASVIRIGATSHGQLIHYAKQLCRLNV